MVTEIVSNAVRHARSATLQLGLELDQAANLVTVSLTDDDPAGPRPRPASKDDENGRGMTLSTR